MTTLSFILMVAFLMTHELDAVKRHEWRVLPLTSFLPEKTGEQVFIWAHVPLTVGLFWVAGQGTHSIAALAVSGFAVLHVALHWLFRRHPANEFNTLSSWLLIAGAGLFGAVHIVAVRLAVSS